jgi:hypothetical protein
MQLATQPSVEVCLPDRQPVTSIYVLRDPDTDAVRYVGKTKMRPEMRLIEHRNSPVNEKMAEWLQSLGHRKPAMQIIEEVTPAYNWPPRERFWIEYFRSRGCDLLNVQPGGLLGGCLLRSTTKWRNTDTPKKKSKSGPRLIYPPRDCARCSKSFHPKAHNHKYCAAECWYAAHYVPKLKRLIECSRCGKSLTPKGRAIKFCTECASAGYYVPKPKRFTFTCVGCGKTEPTHSEIQRFCTEKCRNRFRYPLQGKSTTVLAQLKSFTN